MANKITQAVVLSAGLGTRLASVTGGDLPKVMVPINGKPILEWHIERLRAYGINQIFINLFHLPAAVKKHFGNGSRWGVKIIYSVEKPKILGTAGGIKQFEPKLAEEFIVCYGDTFNLIDFGKMVKSFQARPDALALTMVGDNKHPHDSDLVEVDDELRFIKIHPKPHVKLPKNYKTMQAMHIFNKKILSYIPPKQYFEIDHQLLPLALEKGQKIYGYETADYIKDIGTPSRYKEVQEYAKRLRL